MEMKSLTIGGKTYDEFNPAAAEMNKKLDKTGGTLTGNINMFGYTLQAEQIELKTGNIDGVVMYSESTETDTINKPVLSLYGSNADQAVTIFNVETPTRPYEATNKKYVDSLYASPNNAPLTFTGAVEAYYDGTENVTVNIPSDGGSNWVKVYDGSSTIAEEVSSFEVNLSKSDPMKEFQLWLKLDQNTAADWGANKNIIVKVNGESIGYFLFQHRLNSSAELFIERSLEAMTVAKRLLTPVRLNYNASSPMWMIEQGIRQTNDGKLSISFPAPYAGKITAIVFGRY